MSEREGPSEALVSAFRGCVGEFATGVAVVTAEHEGVPAGMTLNAFTSVSLDPLLVLVSLGSGSRTLHATTASGRFAVSILQRGQHERYAEHRGRADYGQRPRRHGRSAVRGVSRQAGAGTLPLRAG